MALLDLSLVTRTLLAILEARLPTYPDWPATATLTASPAAPDAVSASHALSFYLYHLREEAHTKAQDWQVDDAVPQRFKPMGLSLYYLLCPRSNIADVQERALTDQLLMGLAVKTLRDHPVIEDTTLVDSTTGPRLVMPTSLRGRNNRLRILLQPTPAADATQYWQAGSQPLRLAAYYEVSAALLEPDEPRTRSGRVLTVGVHTFVRGRPRVDRSRNTLTFTLPGETSPREIELSPAEVAYGQTFELVGADLKGDRTTLLLTHRDLIEPVEVDAAWGLASDGQRLTATARASAGGQAILPGIYGALVRTTARRTLPDGSTRDFDFFSNLAPLAIAPRILSVTQAGGVHTIEVDGFEPHALVTSELMLLVGADRLTRTAVDPPPAGTYFTPAAPPAEVHRIRFRFPAGVPAGTLLPLRLVARGIESAPRWELAP